MQTYKTCATACLILALGGGVAYFISSEAKAPDPEPLTHTPPPLPLDIEYDLTTWPYYRLALEHDTWVLDTEPGSDIIEASRAELLKITDRDPYVRISTSTETVRLCAIDYSVPSIKIRGYDLYDTLSRIFSDPDNTNLCDTLAQQPPGLLPVEISKAVLGGQYNESPRALRPFEPLQLIEGWYHVQLGTEGIVLIIDAQSSTVSIRNGFDGSLGIIGYLDQ